MLDLSLGNWRIWYEKVWAIVYLVPSDTKVLEIYLLKNVKMLHYEFLYDKAWIPTRALHVIRLEKLPHICFLLLHWVLSSFIDPYERFVMLLKSRSRTHHIYLLLLHWKYAKTCLPSRSTQKCSTPTLGVNTKTCLIGFPSMK